MKQPQIYAFIDSQNLNLGVKSAGWKLDYRKFRLYLSHKYRVSKAYLFIGMLAGNEALYQSLKDMGYTLVFKPTLHFKKNGAAHTKGNVDAELVLYASAIAYPFYDQAIIVSGDGDFYCLIEFLLTRNKLKLLLAPNKRYSGLLRKFDAHILRVDNLRSSLAYKKDQD